jgi:hypothetical protein
MKEDGYDVFNERFNKLTNKWKLSSGEIVEDTLFNECKNYKYEQ